MPDEDSGLPQPDGLRGFLEHGEHPGTHVCRDLGVRDLNLVLAGEIAGEQVGERGPELVAGHPLARPDVILTQPSVEHQVEPGERDQLGRRLPRAQQIAGPDERRSVRGEESRRALRLYLPQVIERDVGMALGAPYLVPFGPAVPPQHQPAYLVSLGDEPDHVVDEGVGAWPVSAAAETLCPSVTESGSGMAGQSRQIRSRE